MTSPLIVIKTRNGYAFIPYIGDMPQVNLADASCFSALSGSYGSYNSPDTLFGALKEYFEPIQAKAGE